MSASLSDGFDFRLAHARAGGQALTELIPGPLGLGLGDPRGDQRSRVLCRGRVSRP
jgi:hypothetical protein